MIETEPRLVAESRTRLDVESLNRDDLMEYAVRGICDVVRGYPCSDENVQVWEKSVVSDEPEQDGQPKVVENELTSLKLVDARAVSRTISSRQATDGFRQDEPLFSVCLNMKPLNSLDAGADEPAAIVTLPGEVLEDGRQTIDKFYLQEDGQMELVRKATPDFMSRQEYGKTFGDYYRRFPDALVEVCDCFAKLRQKMPDRFKNIAEYIEWDIDQNYQAHLQAEPDETMPPQPATVDDMRRLVRELQAYLPG